MLNILILNKNENFQKIKLNNSFLINLDKFIFKC
jgi:hypothetical protein